jgi:alkyl sulfatase BDS1-like metallo-beta-lactamase superfamily hydrolase
MTLVEGVRGILAVDPLLTAETAVGLALYREHRGDRPVSSSNPASRDPERKP